MTRKNTFHSDIYLIIGQNIAVFRKKSGLNLSELAKKSGISGSFLGNIEKGSRKPTLYTLVRLASALGIGVTALFSHKEKNASLPEDSRLVFEIMKIVSAKSPEDKKRILGILKHL